MVLKCIGNNKPCLFVDFIIAFVFLKIDFCKTTMSLYFIHTHTVWVWSKLFRFDIVRVFCQPGWINKWHHGSSSEYVCFECFDVWLAHILRSRLALFARRNVYKNSGYCSMKHICFYLYVYIIIVHRLFGTKQTTKTSLEPMMKAIYVNIYFIISSLPLRDSRTWATTTAAASPR